MNKIVKILLLLTLPMFMVAQTGPAAPSSGIWALIDTSYTVGIQALHIHPAGVNPLVIEEIVLK